MGRRLHLGAVRASPTSVGWTHNANGVDRNHLGRPLYDSFIPVNGSNTWQIPAANGTHAVVIVCGDADSREQTNDLLVNGVAVTDPTPYDGNVTLGYETGAFDGYAITVTVTTGFITVKRGAGALNPKLNFIEIGATGSAIDPATLARVQAAAVQATHDTSKAKAKTPPTVVRSIYQSYVDDRISYTLQKPRKLAIPYYTPKSHLFSVAATTNRFGNVVERYSYTAYGQQTVKNSVGAVLAKSAFGNDRGFTGYKFDGETGLLHARARKYSPTLGRFTSRDPINYIDGLSLYRFYSAPNSLDPTGLHDWGSTTAGFSTDCSTCDDKKCKFWHRSTLKADPKITVTQMFEYRNSSGTIRRCSRTQENIDRTQKHEEFHAKQARDIAAEVDSEFPKTCTTKEICDEEVKKALAEAKKRYEAAPEPDMPTKTKALEAEESEAAGKCKDAPPPRGE